MKEKLNKMNDIEIIKKTISKKHPCDECHKALDRIYYVKACIEELLLIHSQYGDMQNAIDHSYGLELSMKIIGNEYKNKKYIKIES